jgi:DNA-binding transcriptional LysR family regulator
MKRNLPPLKAVYVFEVAARTESFSETAEILFVTQSAVSKQIKLLEEHLRVRLFDRQGGVVTLTEDGRQYLEVVTKALDIVESGSEKYYSDQKRETLNIDINPSLSVLWIFSRVEQFHQLHPSITLHIDSADDFVDWSKKRADVAIRCLPRDKKHSDAELLAAENLKLIISPKLLKDVPIRSVDDLYKHKLVYLNNRPKLWNEVFQKYELDDRLANIGFGCEHFYMVVQAALEGFGVALVPDFLCEDLLQKRQLINPLNISIASDHNYYFLTPSHKKDESKVLRFKEWVKSQLHSYC